VRKACLHGRLFRCLLTARRKRLAQDLAAEVERRQSGSHRALGSVLPEKATGSPSQGLVELHEADAKQSKSEIAMRLDSRGVDSGSLLHIHVSPALVLLTTSLHPSTPGAED
jgi:hypothetical protein